MTEFAPRAADVKHLSPPFESECGLFWGAGGVTLAAGGASFRPLAAKYPTTQPNHCPSAGPRWAEPCDVLAASPTAELHVRQFRAHCKSRPLGSKVRLTEAPVGLTISSAVTTRALLVRHSE